jgi:hypothetical protein
MFDDRLSPERSPLCCPRLELQVRQHVETGREDVAVDDLVVVALDEDGLALALCLELISGDLPIDGLARRTVHSFHSSWGPLIETCSKADAATLIACPWTS